MFNAGPSLLPQIITKALGTHSPAILEEYGWNREKVFTSVRAEEGWRTATDAELKKLFILAITSAPGTELRHNGHLCHTLSTYKAAVDSMAKLLSQLDCFQEEIALASDSEDQKNKLGRFMSYVGQRAERSVLFALKEYFQQEKYVVGVLINDGLFVAPTSICQTR